MARLTVAEKKAAKTDEGQYISRLWLSGAYAPMSPVSAFGGHTAKVLRVVSSGTRRHTILYIEDLDPNTVI